jgi:hypothetical protein
MQGYNDVKAVKTGINAMRECIVEYAVGTPPWRTPIDMTVGQKFAKSGYATSGLKK